MGVSSRWAASGRCSARSASSTNSPARISRTSGRCDRYVNESKRLLGVLETRLQAGTGSWATSTPSPTSSMLGWVRNLVGFYGAGELVAYDTLKHVPAWLERGLARPAVDRGLDIPKRPGGGGGRGGGGTVTFDPLPEKGIVKLPRTVPPRAEAYFIDIEKGGKEEERKGGREGGEGRGRGRGGIEWRGGGGGGRGGRQTPATPLASFNCEGGLGPRRYFSN